MPSHLENLLDQRTVSFVIEITSNFPGGNILVDGIEGDTVRLRQDRRDSTEWWFYWSFRISGAEGRTLRFVFGDGNVFTAAGPCYSREGETWHWLGPECMTGEAFTHTFTADENEAWFALSHPYTEKHLQQFLAAHPTIQLVELGRSREDRSVELLNLSAAQPEGAVLITCRSHACEAQASFVLEGILDAWLGDEPEGCRLRQSLDLFMVPFVDKDGVERGDQGKLRAPHDHNRDFSLSPIYPECAAIMRLVNADPRRWHYAFDLHCPWIRNADNEKIFFVEGPEPHASALHRFALQLETTHRALVPFYERANIRFGTGWNQGTGATFGRFMREHTSCRLATTLEFPYARAHYATVTPAAAREFGRDFARALAREIAEKSP